MRADRHPASHAAALPDAPPAARAGAAPVSLATLAVLFLRIGCTSVGGFMAMVAMTQQVLVERRRLLPAADLLDGLALASVLPGPVAVNVVAYAGYRLRGAAGAAVAMLCVVLPAFLCIVALAALYFRYGGLGGARSLFLGVTPAIVAVVLAAGCRLWRGAVHRPMQAVLGAGAALALTWLPGLPVTLAVMALAAGAGLWLPPAKPDAAARATGIAPAGARRPARTLLPLLLALVAAVALAWSAGQAAPLARLAGIFGGMSLMTFGGGYAFIPLLQHTVVDTYGWLSPREFTDGLALTQLPPGPAPISAAFVGLKVAGLPGAVAACAGMFVPSAVLMIAASGAMQRLRGSARVQAALCGVRAALAGMVFAAAAAIARLAAPQWLSIMIAAAALYALLRWRLDAAWVVAAAALAGWLLF
jgi:chromate transporter